MKVTIDVRNRDEGDAIRRALDDPATRAFTIVTGVLMELPTFRARARVLRYVSDLVDDQTSEEGGAVTPLILRMGGPSGE